MQTTIVTAALALAAVLAAAAPSGADTPATPLPPPSTSPEYGADLNAAQAEAALRATDAAARALGAKVAIAVVQTSGELVLLKRQDGAAYGTTNAAIEKARTAARFRRDSKVFHDGVVAGRQLLLVVPGMFPAPGGVLIVVDGRIAGAIGVSGATAEQDHELAGAGAAAVATAR